MLSGHLQKRNERFSIYLSWYTNKKRDSILIATGLSIKEKKNKKIAENMLLKARLHFEPEMKYNEEILNYFKINILNLKVKKKNDNIEENQINNIFKTVENVNLAETITENMFFSNYMLRWLLMKKKDIRKDTYQGYKLNIERRIVPYFDERKILLKDVTPDNIQDFYTYVKDKYTLSNNTIIKYHVLIRMALNYAFKTDKISCNPADKIGRPKKEDVAINCYTKQELKVIKGDSIALPVLLTAFYGFRRSEVLGIKWEAIDFTENTILIKHTLLQYYSNGHCIIEKEDKTKTKSSERKMPLSNAIKEILLDAKNSVTFNKKIFGKKYNRDYLDYICVCKNGDIITPSYLSNHFKTLLKNNNLKNITIRDLRHTCATLLFENGARDKDVQDWLGHSDIRTTMEIYVHVKNKPNKELSSLMENIISE